MFVFSSNKITYQEVYFSSSLYHSTYYENFSLGGSVLTMKMYQDTYNALPDGLGISFSISSGTFKDSYHSYILNESLGISLALISGIYKDTYNSYSLRDNLGISCAIQSGIYKTNLITINNNDNFVISFSIISGTLV
jgi:hypothetical protein